MRRDRIGVHRSGLVHHRINRATPYYWDDLLHIWKGEALAYDAVQQELRLVFRNGRELRLASWSPVEPSLMLSVPDVVALGERADDELRHRLLARLVENVRDGV